MQKRSSLGRTRAFNYEDLSVESEANSNTGPVNKKKLDDEEEAGFEGEFVKVEKEPVDVKNAVGDRKLATAETQMNSSMSPSEKEGLLKVQEELRISRLRIKELEQKLDSEGAVVGQLARELTQSKAAEERLKKDKVALESLISPSKQELQIKIASLQEYEFKYEKELKIRKGMEFNMKSQDMRIRTLQEHLYKLTGEKQYLAVESGRASERDNRRGTELDTVRSQEPVDLKTRIGESESKIAFLEHIKAELEQQLYLVELRSNDKDRELKDLHEKTLEIMKKSEEEIAISRNHFQASENKVHKLESSLSKSSERILELEHQVKDFADKCSQHEIRAHQRELEFQDLIQKSHSRSRDEETRVAKLEILLETTKNRVHELEEQLSIGYNKNREAEEELSKFQAMVSELRATAESLQLRSDSLEASLQEAANKEKELIKQLSVITEEKKGFEKSLRSSNEKLLEAENLFEVLQYDLQSTKEKLEGAEELIDASNVREQELLDKLRSSEEQLERQGMDVEMVTAKSMELESRHKSLSKDAELRRQESIFSLTRKETEIELLTRKNQSMEEQVMFHQTQATEALIKEKMLKTELEKRNVTRDKAAEATERAAFFQDQLIEATQRIALLKDELEEKTKSCLSHEKTIDELRIHTHETENQISFYLDKMAEASEKSKLYQDQAAEATEMAASLKAELLANSAKCATLEETIEELRRKAQENEMITKINSKLKEELEATQLMWNSIKAEKEENAKHPTSGENVVPALENQRSRELDFHSAIETDAKENEIRNLKEKLVLLESQVSVYEKQANEALQAAETNGAQLEEASMEVKNLREIAWDFKDKVGQFETENEGLTKTNLTLALELTSCKSRLSELEEVLDTVLADKEETSGQLHFSRKTIEDLREQLSSEGARLQSQISSVMGENALLDQMHQNTKKDLQAVISELEEQLNEQKEKENSLSAHMAELQQKLVHKEFQNAELAASEKKIIFPSKMKECVGKLRERDSLAVQLGNLKKELQFALSSIVQEGELDSKQELEGASTKQSSAEIERKHQHVLSLEKQAEELERKLQIADKQYREKVQASINQSLEEVEAEHQLVLHLQNKVEELVRKVQKAEVQYMEKNEAEVVGNEAGLDRGVKFRDYSLGVTAPVRRKSKKRSEGGDQHTGASSRTRAIIEEHSLVTTLKFIIGIALVSMVVGVLVGKHY